MKGVSDFYSLYYDYVSSISLPSAGNFLNKAAPFLDSSGILHIWRIDDAFASSGYIQAYHYVCDLINAPYLIASAYVSLPTVKPYFSQPVCLGKSDSNYMSLPHNDGNGGVVLIDENFAVHTLYSATAINAAATHCVISNGYAYYICLYPYLPPYYSLNRTNILTGASVDITLPAIPDNSTRPYFMGINSNTLVIGLAYGGVQYCDQYDLATLTLIAHNPLTSVVNTDANWLQFSNNKIFYIRSGVTYHIDNIGGTETADILIPDLSISSYIYPHEIFAIDNQLIRFFSDPFEHSVILLQKLGSACPSLPLNSVSLNNLLANYQFFLAELYTITLKNGTIYYLTSGDGDITYGCNLYQVGTVRIQRGDITSAIGVEVSDVEVSLLCNADSLIGSISVQQFAVNGGFDGATAKIELAVMPTYGDTSAGAIHLFEGIVTDCKPDMAKVVLTVSSDLILLNAMTPKNVYQPTCIHTTFDSQCGLSKAAFTVTSSAATGSTVTQLLCALAQAAGHFDMGTLLFTSGANAGASRVVRTYTPGVINLAYPLEHVPVVGDAFSITAGDDKLRSTCSAKFGNEANFLGFEYMPVPEASA